MTAHYLSANCRGLRDACHQGNIVYARNLIKNGYNVNATDVNGNTPLILAAYNGHLNIVKLLIQKGANVNLSNNDFHTPLELAVINGHLNIVKILIKEKNVVNAFFLALTSENIEIAKYLLDQGVHVQTTDLQTIDIYSCLQLMSSYRGFKEFTIDLLEKVKNFQKVDEAGNTRLLVAIAMGFEELTLSLIEKTNNFDHANEDGNMALHLAIQKGFEDLALILIEKTNNFDHANKAGNTPLLWAIKKGYEELALILIEKTNNFDKANKAGNTPLLWAIEKGLAELANAIKEKVNEKKLYDLHIKQVLNDNKRLVFCDYCKNNIAINLHQEWIMHNSECRRRYNENRIVASHSQPARSRSARSRYEKKQSENVRKAVECRFCKNIIENSKLSKHMNTCISNPTND